MLTGDTHVLTLRQETSTIGTFGVVASLVRPDLPVLSIISTYYSISIHQDFISSLLDYCSQLSSTRLPYTVTAADLFQCFPFWLGLHFFWIECKRDPKWYLQQSLSFVYFFYSPSCERLCPLARLAIMTNKALKAFVAVPLVKDFVAWQDLLLWPIRLWKPLSPWPKSLGSSSAPASHDHSFWMNALEEVVR